MKILVLGGTGAIGVPLVDILIENGHEVYVTSRRKKFSSNQLSYIQGNAHDIKFLKDLLKDKYDIIIDFMLYSTHEFEERYSLFLNSCKQYIFTSSCRVFANSNQPITEESPRLLDVINDNTYLKTDEYALSKARQENILLNSQLYNWTIIRPYITYNVERLQLGALEKDIWLKRALSLESVPFPTDISRCYTTLTYARDVAYCIFKLIDNDKALGECFNITTSENVQWKKIFDIYRKILNSNQINIITYSPCNSMDMAEYIGNYYQVKYDRLFNRKFNNSKILNICGNDYRFVSVEEGLDSCLSQFILSPHWIGPINCKCEAYFDRKSHSFKNLKRFQHKSDFVKYTAWYYFSKSILLLKNVVGGNRI